MPSTVPTMRIPATAVPSVSGVHRVLQRDMEQPDRTQLRLSDLFYQAEGVPCLECTATMININYGHNEEMMKSCRKLYEYAFLINAVRSRLNEGLHLEAAVDQAVEDCIQHDVLKNFLLKHREEVREMIYRNTTRNCISIARKRSAMRRAWKRASYRAPSTARSG